MDTTFEESAITPKRGKIKPVDIFSLERRKIDEDTVADLVNALTRDGNFLHPIVVREEGATAYRLIAGHHRLEAWKRHFGKQAPIPAIIYPSDTPDALITVLEIEENLLRKELSAGERQAETIRLAAALKELDGEKLATELPVSASKGKSATTGGKKAATAKVASQLRVSKAAVQKRIKAASAAIGEKIDLDRDTPEELERKADKRQHAERTVERPKRRKPAPRGVTEDPTPPAEPHAGKIDSQIEALWKAFDAIGRTYQLRFIHDACLRLGLDPLNMAPPAAFGLAEEELELAVDSPAEVPPATDDAAVAHAGQREDAVHLGGEEMEDAGENAAAAADLDAEELGNAGDEVSEAADQQPGGAETCAYCHHEFVSGGHRHVVNGRPYHDGFCLDYAKKIASAAA